MSKLFVFAESFYAFKVSYSGLRELSFAIKFRTARKVLHTFCLIIAWVRKRYRKLVTTGNTERVFRVVQGVRFTIDLFFLHRSREKASS